MDLGRLEFGVVIASVVVRFKEVSVGLLAGAGELTLCGTGF